MIRLKDHRPFEPIKFDFFSVVLAQRKAGPFKLLLVAKRHVVLA
jgi:hypothetical protein